MSDETKAKLVLEAEAKGFDAVQKTIENVIGAVDGTGGKSSMMTSLERTLQGITHSLSKLDEVVQRLSKSAKGIGDTSRKADGSGSRSEERPDPSFLRGVLQGIGVAQYMPGMTPLALAKQTAGVSLGRGVSSLGRGIFGSAFTGMSGLAQSLSALPGGGMASGMAHSAIAAVEDALELERARMGAASMFDLRGTSAAAASARARTAQLWGPDAAKAFATQQGIDAYSRTFSRQSLDLPVSEADRAAAERAAANPWGYGPRPTSRPLGVEDVERRASTAQGEATTSALAEFASRAQRAQDEAAAAARQRAMFGQDFQGLGVRYGLDEIALTGAAGQLLGARGGYLGQAQEGGGLRAALAAQGRFGVDYGTSGQLLRGMRTGALSGQGPEGDQLARLIGRARGMGLEGSEVSEYLSQIAAGIQQFAATGIPIATDAQEGIARKLIDTGMSNSVAAARASNLASSIQGRAQQGLPGSAVDFAALVHLGGYQGGGSESALSARARLARGEFAPGGMEQMTRLFAQQLGTGPQGRAYGVEMGYRQLGLQLNPDEAAALEAQSAGRTLSPEQQARIEAAQTRLRARFGSADELDAEAQQSIGGGTRRQAEIRNKRIATGQTSMQAVQDFETRAAGTTQAFSHLIDKLRVLNPLLDTLADGFGDMVRSVTGANVSGSH